MGAEVNRLFRVSMRSVALLSLAGVTAGCSSDAARLSDSFYRGAMPQNSMQTASAPTPGIDQTSTGSIGAPGGGMPVYGASPVASAQPMLVTPPYGATSSVTRSQLPPPPGSAAYQPVPQPGDVAGSMAPSSVPGAPASMAPAPMATAAVAPKPRPAAPAAAASAAPATMAAAQPKPVVTAPQPQVASGGPSVTVQPGDSLNAIAKRTGISVADLRGANGLASDNIRIGQTLNLPAGGNTRVAALGAAPTTLQAQAASPAAAAPRPVAVAPAVQAPAAVQAPVAAAPTSVAAETQTQSAALAPASTGAAQFRWPVQGRVVKGFGDKIGSRRNDGVNISVPRGTPVKAAENGVVIYAGEGLKEFGKTVLVKHDNGLVTVYGHADDILVERGATVRRGEDIAKAGMTGDTEVPMLHFEVRKDSSPVDPMTYLQ